MDQERVHRDTLYADVWAEPMLTIAPKYGVSAVFLARVCARMNIPCPPRGYWAKKKAGHDVRLKPLPKAKPGDAIEWKKGDVLPAPAAISTAEPKTRGGMIIGSLEAFTAGKVCGDGYLKPTKRNLPDLIVTEKTLGRAAKVLIKLANSLREAGHRISIVCSEPGFIHCRLGDEHGRLKRSFLNANLWSPGKPTLVFIGETAIGITIYEQTVEKSMVYLGGQYIPVQEAQKALPGLWDKKTKTFHRPTTQRAASGRLCLKAYSPYSCVEWSHTWTEDNSPLSKQVEEVVNALITKAGGLAVQVIEQRRRIDEEHRRWALEQAAAQERYRRESILKARSESLKNLLAVIGEWEQSRRIEAFFIDILSRSTCMGDQEKASLLSKVGEARSLITASDSIAALMAWKAPPDLPDPKP